jgi:hypothetical protein
MAFKRGWIDFISVEGWIFRSGCAMKYQVLVRTETIDKGLPLYLKTKYAFHAPPSNAKGSFRDELIRELPDLSLDERLEAKEFVA